MLDNLKVDWLDYELERLQGLAVELPSHFAQEACRLLRRRCEGNTAALIVSEMGGGGVGGR